MRLMEIRKASYTRANMKYISTNMLMTPSLRSGEGNRRMRRV